MIFVTILWFIIYFSISTDTNNMILVLNYDSMDTQTMFKKKLQ